MEQKGQISVELVLLIGLIVVIILAIVPFIGQANENNIIMSAARSGATNATSTIVLLNRSMAPIRVENIRLIDVTDQDKIILIHLSSVPANINVYSSIVDSTLNSIASQGYTRSDSGTPTIPLDDIIITSRHRYGVVIA